MAEAAAIYTIGMITGWGIGLAIQLEHKQVTDAALTGTFIFGVICPVVLIAALTKLVMLWARK